jgi:hypothetical protein
MTTKPSDPRTQQDRGVEKHPEELRADLNPDALAGQNIGTGRPEQAGALLYDVKDAHTRFAELSAAELKRVRIVPPGSRLLNDATYIDLNDPERREFTATGEMEVGDDGLIVAKADTDYELWNRLRRVPEPYRTGSQA